MYKCSECFATYCSSESLKKHILNKHQNTISCRSNSQLSNNSHSIVSLNQDRNWDIENSSLCINPNQISEDEPVTVNITESLEESLKNLNVSRNTELKIVELFKQYTNMLKEQNNLNFEEPNWEYLFNK